MYKMPILNSKTWNKLQYEMVEIQIGRFFGN
jgi:hypothetical protein